MFLDARQGARGFYMWHAEWCVHLQRTVWVDDEAAQWGEYAKPWRLVDGSPLIITQQAKRIVILLERKLVIVNPIDDPEAEQLQASTPVGEGLQA